MTNVSDDFLWGAATSPHQVEGNNTNSGFWRTERLIPGMQRSGDALDSYHRYREDMKLLAEAGLNSYRFGIEWARIEPDDGAFSVAELQHYRRMIDYALELGLEPVITLNHFSVPRWFEDQGDWNSPSAVAKFQRYVTQATSILEDVQWVLTMNEPNVLTKLAALPVIGAALARGDGGAVTDTMKALPPETFSERLIEIHSAARQVVRDRTPANVGWSIAAQAFTPTEGNESKYREVFWAFEGIYYEASREDDFIGIQAYTSQPIDADGPVDHPPAENNTLTGAAFRPDSLGIAVRQAWEATGGVPILVTENGIATSDDAQRVAYTRGALDGLFEAMDDGVDVRGYIHWSLLDNYEWGHWTPTYGLIEVDRETFERRPKASLAWLGSVSKNAGRLT